MKNRKIDASSPVERLIEAFWETVPPLWHTVRAQHHQVAAENFEITADQFHILHRIHRGHCTVSDLANAKHISRAASSRAVDLLVNKGLVSRHPDLKDRRRVHLELTAEGKVLLENLFQRSQDWMANKLNALDEEQIEAISRSLAVLKQVFNIKDMPHHKPLSRKK